MIDEAVDGARVKAGASKSASAFRTISEVSVDLEVPQHVLRFWETKFPQIKPLKRGGGRRYYRPDDVELLRRIQALLYQDGYTIKGVQKLLRESRGLAGLPSPGTPMPSLFDADEHGDEEPATDGAADEFAGEEMPTPAELPTVTETTAPEPAAPSVLTGVISPEQMTPELRQLLSDVLLNLLDRLEAGALFTEESCSFSQKDLLDNLQIWADKAQVQLEKPH